MKYWILLAALSNRNNMFWAQVADLRQVRKSTLPSIEEVEQELTPAGADL